MEERKRDSEQRSKRASGDEMVIEGREDKKSRACGKGRGKSVQRGGASGAVPRWRSVADRK